MKISVNEINKMQPEFDLNSDTQSFLFSFVELLNDTNFYYLCSLRGVIKIDPKNSLKREIYFICSFLNVNDIMINPNYVNYMNKLVNSFSSCCRLLNLSNLVVLDPAVQENLFKGQSISSSSDPNSPYFSDRINNSSYFRDRFGEKGIYVFGIEKLTNEQINQLVISRVTAFNLMYLHFIFLIYKLKIFKLVSLIIIVLANNS
jgi:hypothetical protein